jgi:hypothetical protein
VYEYCLPARRLLPTNPRHGGAHPNEAVQRPTMKYHTLEEVGQQFSVTRERIRQIEAKAIRKLKHPSRSRMLRSFLND